MAAPTKLFLEFQNDSKFHIVDGNKTSFGKAYEIPDAIKDARTRTNAPIDIGDSHAGFSRQCVPTKPDHAEEDSEVFIQMLAEIGGMKVTKLFNDDMHFIGYTMELAEDNDDSFTEAEIAAEAYESELVNAMGSYMEDE